MEDLFDQFMLTLRSDQLPRKHSIHLRALWFDAKGDWNSAHHTIQDLEDSLSARIHAYLHRQEGDQFNARYWYAKAGTSYPEISLKKEWEELTKQALSL